MAQDTPVELAQEEALLLNEFVLRVAPDKSTTRNPWAWVPTLYLAEGLPYVVVMTVAVIMYKELGLSNTDIALYTSWLYLPWVIKPLWSPVVDILKTRRVWIWVMQLVVGAGLAGVALSLPASGFLRYSLAFLWLLAFSSATHDVAADGFYMLALAERQQSFFVGIRNTFYRVATITGQGLLVILAGVIQNHTGLTAVQLRVETQPGAPLVERFNPRSFAGESPAAGEPRLVVQPSELKINPQPRAPADVNALVAAAKQWNATNHFTGKVTPTELESGNTAETSWWSRRVAGPLRRFLETHFGSRRKATDKTGANIGLFYLRLSKPPAGQVVVTLTFLSGDKSVSLIQGGRLVFDDRNWNLPAVAIIQLDPKLKSNTSARFEARSGNIPLSWSIAFAALACLFVLFGVYHRFILPRPMKDQAGSTATVIAFLKEFFRTFGDFFGKDNIGWMLSFLLLYRFAEAQLVKMVSLFLLDGREAGGLGLTTAQVGLVYGTIGVIALTCGGLLGGMLVSRHGLKAWLWPMVAVMQFPDAVFLFLSYAQPSSLTTVSACVALEQFGYGFGFTAYMLYMIYIVRGRHQTAHYAICTGFMALGMMLPGLWSGWLQETIGYRHFFMWVLLATIPGFIVTALIPLEREFGKKG